MGGAGYNGLDKKETDLKSADCKGSEEKNGRETADNSGAPREKESPE